MVVTMVTITAYCYDPRTRTCPRQKGSFLAIFQYGGRERAAPVVGPELRQRAVQRLAAALAGNEGFGGDAKAAAAEAEEHLHEHALHR